MQLGRPQVYLGTLPRQERLDKRAPEIAPPFDAITSLRRWIVRDVSPKAGVEQVPQQTSGKPVDPPWSGSAHVRGCLLAEL